jgi:hypothetical protein
MVKLLVTKVNDDFSCLVENQVVAKNKGAKEYEVEYCEWLGKFYLADHVPVKPEPTKEEVQALRSDAYKAEVDPITCHIQRLGDEEQTAEVITEIANLVAERKAKVEEIKARYPYPAEPIEENEELEE